MVPVVWLFQVSTTRTRWPAVTLNDWAGTFVLAVIDPLNRKRWLREHPWPQQPAL